MKVSDFFDDDREYTLGEIEDRIGTTMRSLNSLVGDAVMHMSFLTSCILSGETLNADDFVRLRAWNTERLELTK